MTRTEPEEPARCFGAGDRVQKAWLRLRCGCAAGKPYGSGCAAGKPYGKGVSVRMMGHD